MRTAFRLLPVVVVAASIGCASRVPFTPALAEQFSEEDLKGIQFYISDRIVLHRDVTSAGQSVTPRGRIVLENGKQIEEVLIKKGSPGVELSQEKGRSITVSFEPPIDNVESFLRFDASRRDGSYFLMMSTVKYGTELFQVQDGLQKAYIQVDADRLENIDAHRRTAPGRTVNGPN